MQLATGENPVSPTPQPSRSPPAVHGPGAWEPLTLERAFDEHHSLIFRVAYRMTGNAHDAEDVLQTVFLRLAARDAASAGIENAESYLRRAAVHASLNLLELRSRKDIPLRMASRNPPARGINLRRAARSSRSASPRHREARSPLRRDVRPPLHRGPLQSGDRGNVRRVRAGGGSHSAPSAQAVAKRYS